MSLENQQEVLVPISEAVAQEGALRERIRQLVLDALVKREVDATAVREVMRDAMDGIGIGLGQRAGQAGEALSEAVGGLDEALSRTLYAMQQAVEEGWAQGRQFAQSDMKEAYDSVKGLDDDLLGVLKSTGEKAQGVLRNEFEAIRGHLTTTGTDTGRQMKQVLEVLGNRLNSAAAGSGQEAREAAQLAGGRLREVASGILRGLADALDKR
jgi:ElaB/YqjD/DUF883 family membrane-anchored ribosome-binding protein